MTSLSSRSQMMSLCGQLKSIKGTLDNHEPPRLLTDLVNQQIQEIEVCLLIIVFIYLFMYLFMYLFIYLFMYLFIYLFIYLFMYLFIYLFIYLFMYLFMYLECCITMVFTSTSC